MNRHHRARLTLDRGNTCSVGGDTRDIGVATIDTARLTVERVRPEDLDVLAQLLADPAVAATLWPAHLGGPRSRDQTAELLAHDVEHWEQHGFGAWILLTKRSGELVGRGGLERTTVGGRGSVEVFYAVASGLWRRGYATEMADAAVDAAKRLALPEIVGFTLTTNHASQRVLAKIGLRTSRVCSTQGYRIGLADARSPIESSLSLGAAAH